MFMAGFVLVIAITIIMFKVKRRLALWVLGHHTTFDILFTVMMTIVHWGTFTGLMAAAFAGMCFSLMTWFGRWAFGYIEGKKFHPGKFVIEVPK